MGKLNEGNRETDTLVQFLTVSGYQQSISQTVCLHPSLKYNHFDIMKAVFTWILLFTCITGSLCSVHKRRGSVPGMSISHCPLDLCTAVYTSTCSHARITTHLSFLECDSAPSRSIVQLYNKCGACICAEELTFCHWLVAFIRHFQFHSLILFLHKTDLIQVR